MGAVFVILGLSTSALGGLWVYGVFAESARGSYTSAVLASAPGFSVIFAGLVLIGLGQIISLLARIARNTGDTADAVEASQPPRD